MRGILCGLAGIAPRSVIQNLITLLVWLLTRVPGDSRIWAHDILFGVCNPGVPWPGLTCTPFPERFRTMQGWRGGEGEVFGGSDPVSVVAISSRLRGLNWCRSSKGNIKRVRDAANQFALVARGFEGSGFGYGATQL